MAILFQTRQLVSAFSNRSVVAEASGIRAVNGDLIFKAYLSFGRSGSLGRQETIKTTGLTLLQVRANIMKYHDDLIEIIDVLENFRGWLESGATEDFNQVVVHDRPLLFNGIRRKRNMLFRIFGEGLYDLAIQLDESKNEAHRVFLVKLLAITEFFRQHLRDLDSIKVNQIAEGTVV